MKAWPVLLCTGVPPWRLTRSGQARVVNDLRPGIPGQEGLGEQADDIVSLDELPLLVEQEAAVEIAIPGNTQRGAVGQHRFARGTAVLGEQRIGDAMREAAIGIVIEPGDGKRQLLCEQVDDWPGTAVAGIDHDLQGAQRGHINVAEQVAQVGDPVRADLKQPGVAADRPGPGPHQLHAIPVGRVMTGGHHDPAASLGEGRGEIDLLGAAQADVEDINAAFGQTAYQCLRQ